MTGRETMQGSGISVDEVENRAIAMGLGTPAGIDHVAVLHAELPGIVKPFNPTHVVDTIKRVL